MSGRKCVHASGSAPLTLSVVLKWELTRVCRVCCCPSCHVFCPFFFFFFFFLFFPRENGAQSKWTSDCPTDCTVRDGSEYLDGVHWLYATFCGALHNYSNSKQMRFSKKKKKKKHLICWIKLQADLKIVWHDFKNNIAAKYKIVVWYLILLSVLFFFFFFDTADISLLFLLSGLCSSLCTCFVLWEAWA